MRTGARATLVALLAMAAAPAQAACLDAASLASTPLTVDRKPAPAPKGAVLYGRVTSNRGKPVAGARVQALPISPGARGAATQTDALGRYALKGLVPSAVGIVVRRPGEAALGPLPVRILDNGDSKTEPAPQELNIGGYAAAPTSDKPMPGPPLANTVFDLPTSARGLSLDGRGGVIAVGLNGIYRLTPKGGAAPVVRMGGGDRPRAAACAPGTTMTSGPGAAGSDLYVASYGGSKGALQRYRPDGKLAWCVSLPLKPLHVAVDHDGRSWVTGADELGRNGLFMVSPTGRPERRYRLATSGSLDLAVDDRGTAWVPNGTAGLVHLDSKGKVLGRPELPMAVRQAFPSGDGGVWLVGGGVATRLDRQGKIAERTVRPAPILMATADPRGHLWLFEEGRLVEVYGGHASAHDLKGRKLQGVMGLVADSHRHLWLLGSDRTSIAVADI